MPHDKPRSVALPTIAGFHESTPGNTGATTSAQHPPSLLLKCNFSLWGQQAKTQVFHENAVWPEENLLRERGKKEAQVFCESWLQSGKSDQEAGETARSCDPQCHLRATFAWFSFWCRMAVVCGLLVNLMNKRCFSGGFECSLGGFCARSSLQSSCCKMCALQTAATHTHSHTHTHTHTHTRDTCTRTHTHTHTHTQPPPPTA